MIFHFVTWIEKDQYTLIEQSVHNSCEQLVFTITLAITINDICIQFRYIILCA